VYILLPFLDSSHPPTFAEQFLAVQLLNLVVFLAATPVVLRHVHLEL
jgi:hypothetical protein